MTGPELHISGGVGGTYARYEDLYTLAGDSDGRVRASLEIVWMSGWAPHESQQKPLKPGSAEISLAQVLKPRG